MRKAFRDKFATRLRVESYDGSGIERKIVDQEEARNINLKSFDCATARCLGVSGYRDPVAKRWVEFSENHRRMEGKLLTILEVVQNRPGVRLDGLTIATLMSDDVITAADTYRLRTAFGETKATEHYILTDTGISWRADATWIRVEMMVRKRKPGEIDPELEDFSEGEEQ